MPVKSWQVKDYRKLTEEDLFNAFEKDQCFLDKQTFLSYVDKSDSPEELADTLFHQLDILEKEQRFLYIFELWRRLAPHKQTLSIFSDEMDHLIEEYEEGMMENEESLEGSLLLLQQILDNHVDEGGVGGNALSLISPYFCHHLEAFIYEYIAYQMDQEKGLYASEMLEGLYSYVKQKRWLDFLRIRLVFAVDEKEAKRMVSRLLEFLQEEIDLPLLFELLYFLNTTRAHEEYLLGLQTALDEVKIEGDIKTIGFLCASYLNHLGEFEKEKKILDLMALKKEPSDTPSALSEKETLNRLQELMGFAFN